LNAYTPAEQLEEAVNAVAGLLELEEQLLLAQGEFDLAPYHHTALRRSVFSGLHEAPERVSIEERLAQVEAVRREQERATAAPLCASNRNSASRRGTK